MTLELWRIRNTPSLPSLPGPFWPRVVAPDRALSMDEIELNSIFESLLFWHLNCVLMLNWIARNRIVLTSNIMLNWIIRNKLRSYGKLNYLKENCFDIETVLTLNRLVWIRTFWLNWIAWNRNVSDKLWTYTKLNFWKRTDYLYKNGFGVK